MSLALILTIMVLFILCCFALSGAIFWLCVMIVDIPGVTYRRALVAGFLVCVFGLALFVVDKTVLKMDRLNILVLLLLPVVVAWILLCIVYAIVFRPSFGKTLLAGLLDLILRT